MIPGVIASGLRRSGAVPGWVPDGAIAHLDFLNEQYFADGSIRVVGELLGGGFDADEIGVGGLLINDENANRPDAIGILKTALIAALNSGGTIVLEFETTSTVSGGLIYFMDDVDYDASIEYLQISFGSGAGGVSMADFWDLDYFGGSGDIGSPGVNRVALTLARDIGGGDYEFAHSINGGTVQSATIDYLITSHMIPVETIAILHQADATGELSAWLRTLTIYEAVASTELPTLSTA